MTKYYGVFEASWSLEFRFLLADWIAKSFLAKFCFNKQHFSYGRPGEKSCKNFWKLKNKSNRETCGNNYT